MCECLEDVLVLARTIPSTKRQDNSTLQWRQEHLNLYRLMVKVVQGNSYSWLPH